jgi:hypothetical protein
MIDLDKPRDGLDYELIPVDYVDHDDAWDVRILRGAFTETVIRFGTIRFDGERDCLTFDFRVVTSPDPDLSSESEELQEFAADILEQIIERGATEGWIYATERKDGNTTGTNDSEESTY